MDALGIGLTIFGTGLLALAGVGAYVFLLPENRRRRAARADMHDLDRAARKPHRHEWARWKVDQKVNVYAEGKRSETSYPIRRETWQKRTCETCGFNEWKKEVSG